MPSLRTGDIIGAQFRVMVQRMTPESKPFSYTTACYPYIALKDFGAVGMKVLMQRAIMQASREWRKDLMHLHSMELHITITLYRWERYYEPLHPSEDPFA